MSGEIDGALGTAFAVWAPAARAVSVVGDFNAWDGRLHAMRVLGGSGVWELFIPGVEDAAYKFEILTEGAEIRLKADPFAFRTSAHAAHRLDRAPLAPRLARRGVDGAPAGDAAAHRTDLIYEVHLGLVASQARAGQPSLTYRRSPNLPTTSSSWASPTCSNAGDGAPVHGSWGYQVTGYFAPTAASARPTTSRFFVDRLHAGRHRRDPRLGAGAFPSDGWALAASTAPRSTSTRTPAGAHPDWGTLIFNYGRHEVRSFLIASALFWLRRATTSTACAWTPSPRCSTSTTRASAGRMDAQPYGGRENLEAIDFLQATQRDPPPADPACIDDRRGVHRLAGVSRPTYVGGLGFGFKWNMGWMHDTLDYFAHDPIYRSYHHDELTFGLLYAFTENFILPLSHDEVVHGKGSLLAQDAGRPLAAIRQSARAVRLHVGAPRQEAAVHGRRVRTGARMEPRAVSSTGICSSAPSTPACSASCAT